MNKIRIWFKQFFQATDVVVFRYRQSGKWKDRLCDSIEQAKSLAFKFKMNNGQEYQILKAHRQSGFETLCESRLQWKFFGLKEGFKIIHVVAAVFVILISIVLFFIFK